MNEANQKEEYLRHSLAHLLAAAVLELYPDAKPTLGPAIEHGFYYDIKFSSPPSEDDLPSIEKKMRELLPKWEVFQGIPVTADEARRVFADNPYKLELIDEIAERGEDITLYYSGPSNAIPSKEDLLKIRNSKLEIGFIDLCRGGHVESPAKKINADSFKLDTLAGAYWRGDENRTQLTRIYGLAFQAKEELDKFLERREEAKKRDHRRVGKEMGLFAFSDLIGAGLPVWGPKGTALRNALQDRLLEISKKYHMQPVTIPHIAKRKLYEISGHAEKFGDELLRVESHYDEFVMKPVNCPHHTQIYASEPRSYRDLPVRFMESTMQYRDEKPGEIGGLTRVRAITVDDGHIFCMPEQIKAEAKNIAYIIEEFYTSLGLFGNHWVSLSVRNPETPDAYIGDIADWEKAEGMLREVSDDLGLDARRIEGEAAIYGPKLDYMFEDSLGREWQLATIQIDFAMPKRFELEYVNDKGEKQTPVMIHRAILGSYERFLAILIEHFAGNFPLWLAPTQAVILPVSDSQNEYAQQVLAALGENNMRAEIWSANESLGKRIRNAEVAHIPLTLVVGEKEEEAKAVNVRWNHKDGSPQEDYSLDDFTKLIAQKVAERSLE